MMAAANPELVKYALAANGDFFVKQGAYAELEQPITHDLDVIARVDGMRHTGNVLATSELSSASSVLRGTLGVAIAVERNLRLKGSTELWRFSDDDHDSATRQYVVGVHVGAVGT